MVNCNEVLDEIKNIVEDNDWSFGEDYYGRYGKHAAFVIQAPEKPFCNFAKELCDELSENQDEELEVTIAKLAIVKAALSKIDTIGKYDSVFEVEV